MPTGKQIRAARVLLDWDASDLAARIGMRRETILSVENNTSPPRPSTVTRIVEVFEQQGVEFLESSGVRLRDDTVRVIEGDTPYLQLLDDVYYTLKEGDEVLFAYVCNRVSSKKVIESQMRLRHAGIKFRTLIAAADDYCLYPLEEYRQVPNRFFENNAQVIYGDKVGTMIDADKIGSPNKNHQKALIIRNASFAETQRKTFNLIWSLHAAPTKSSAPKADRHE